MSSEGTHHSGLGNDVKRRLVCLQVCHGVACSYVAPRRALSFHVAEALVQPAQNVTANYFSKRAVGRLARKPRGVMPRLSLDRRRGPRGSRRRAPTLGAVAAPALVVSAHCPSEAVPRCSPSPICESTRDSSHPTQQSSWRLAPGHTTHCLPVILSVRRAPQLSAAAAAESPILAADCPSRTGPERRPSWPPDSCRSQRTRPSRPGTPPSPRGYGASARGGRAPTSDAARAPEPVATAPGPRVATADAEAAPPPVAPLLRNPIGLGPAPAGPAEEVPTADAEAAPLPVAPL